jgi:hypothetical protein
MLPAEPAQPRQLSDRDPILLWRDAPSGRRQGLALLPESCEKPACNCREMSLEVLAITDDLIGIATSDNHISIISARQSAGHGACVLRARVDTDSGAAKVDKDGAPAHQDAAALTWLRSELSAGPLLDRLRRRFRLDKHLAVEPPPPRAFAWKGWKPGDRVCWEEVFPEATRIEPVVLAGRTFRVREWYCANPDCDCHDVQLLASESLPDGKERSLGSLLVDFRDVILLKLSGAEEHAAVPLAEVWAAIKLRHDVARYFGHRHRAIQAAAGVRGSQARPTTPPPKRIEAPRNAPCPCGSGLKYKRCCLGKHDPFQAGSGVQEASRGVSDGRN